VLPAAGPGVAGAQTRTAAPLV